MKKKTIIILSSFLFLFLVFPFISSLPFYPSCTFYETPESIMPGWNESYDYEPPGRGQDYCLYDSETLFISMPVFINRLGQPFTSGNPDLYFILPTPIVEQAPPKIKTNVLVEFDYYFPSYSGICVPNSMNTITGLFNSPQIVLMANHQEGFSEISSFDDTQFWMNNLVTCDEWNHFSRYLNDGWINDYGNSFPHSKEIGSFGFEMKNVYIKNITITGTTQAFRVW